MFDRLKTANQNIQFNLNIQCSKKAEDVELALYRIIQEAINNALKHASPNKIDVNLIEVDKLIELSIKNDGQSPTHLCNAGHFGIEGMQERAHFVGGELSFEIPQDGGLIVQLKISKS